MSPQLQAVVGAVISQREPLGRELGGLFPGLRPVTSREVEGPINPGRLAFFLWNRLRTDKARHIGDLVLDVYDKFGHGTLEEINAVLDELVTLGLIERLRIDGGLSYRRLEGA